MEKHCETNWITFTIACNDVHNTKMVVETLRVMNIKKASTNMSQHSVAIRTKKTARLLKGRKEGKSKGHPNIYRNLCACHNHTSDLLGNIIK